MGGHGVVGLAVGVSTDDQLLIVWGVIATGGIDLAKPRRSTWLADRYALPQTYWRRILRGKV